LLKLLRYTAAVMPVAKAAKTASSKNRSSGNMSPANKKAMAAKPAKASNAAKPDFSSVFSALRQILEPFRKQVAVQADKPGNYHTEISSILHRGKPLYFAGIRTGKNYVSFYLMPMYNCMELHQGMSPALKKRMQGKACFNFSAVDPACFAELGRLTAAGLKIFNSEKFRENIQKMQ
jgi:hypothetical protein